MRSLIAHIGRLAAFFVLGAALMLADTSVALAQAQACTQITNLLRGIDNNRVYRNHEAVATQLRETENAVQQAESHFVRIGCQRDLNAGQPLSRDCRSLAQSITGGRSQVQSLAAQARDGQELAEVRQTLLQDFARFSCGSGQSAVTVRSAPNQPGQRTNLLQDMFGGGPGDGIDYREDHSNPWSTMQTRRTVCVRTTDGFFWPISFSTVDDYIAQDAIKCHEMCPGSEVILFSYRNPGQEPEDMISLSGVPYRSMPYAFAYRERFDTESSCQPRATMGTVAMAQQAGQERATTAFEDLSFPLPQRDPRSRPQEDGAAPMAPSGSAANDLRIVTFGDKPVRIVGPVTPYAPEGAGET